jgi:inosine-uridine nucleoside N-ribohydrolase
MQFPGQGKPPVGIVFDAGMGRGIDAPLALALLHGFVGKDEARIASISVSNANLNAAAYCDIVGRFYASATTGPAAQFLRGLPIGLANGKSDEDTPMITAPLSKRNAEGKLVYSTQIRELNDTAEVAPLIRNALTAQYDQNAIVIMTGPATNLVKVLELHDTKDLIARKVKFAVFASGGYPDGPAEFNVQADIPATRKFFAEWPTPIVAAGNEIGEALPFPASSIEKDFAWTPNHPVVDAYRAYKTMPYDAPSWAMSAVLYAVRPQEGYFKLSDPGTIGVLDDGRCRFHAAAAGKHRYLILDPAQKQRIIGVYTEIASAKPVERKFRFPGQQQEKKDEPKPPAPKPLN